MLTPKPAAYGDQVIADAQVQKWFEALIKKMGPQPSNEIRHDNFEGAGRVSSLWVNNRPCATAILLRDTYNYTNVVFNIHDWSD